MLLVGNCLKINKNWQKNELGLLKNEINKWSFVPLYKPLNQTDTTIQQDSHSIKPIWNSISFFHFAKIFSINRKLAFIVVWRYYVAWKFICSTKVVSWLISPALTTWPYINVMQNSFFCKIITFANHNHY